MNPPSMDKAMQGLVSLKAELEEQLSKSEIWNDLQNVNRAIEALKGKAKFTIKLSNGNGALPKSNNLPKLTNRQRAFYDSILSLANKPIRTKELIEAVTNKEMKRGNAQSYIQTLKEKKVLFSPYHGYVQISSSEYLTKN